MNYIKYIIVILSFIVILNVNAKEVLYGKGQEQLSIAYGEETILRFPSLVKTVSNTSDFEILPADIVDPDYTLLKIKPIFRKAKGRVLFILDDGSIVKVNIRTIKKGMPSNTDLFYEFISNKSVINKHQNITTISDLELLKAMIRNDNVTGYNIRKLRRTVWNTKKGLRVRLVKIYIGKNLTGYVFRLSNTSNKKTLKIDPKDIHLGKPNQAILAQLDDNILYPRKIGKAVTYLRIVSKPTTVYSDLKLPFETVRRNKE